jgi:hypothetical protein
MRSTKLAWGGREKEVFDPAAHARLGTREILQKEDNSITVP